MKEWSAVGLPAQELYFAEDEQARAVRSDASLSSFVQEVPKSVPIEEKIKIIGIGGGGRNALNHIITCGSGGVGCLAVDTDVRNLEKAACKDKLILGRSGTGAGCVPQNGEDAARESLGEIMDFVRGADMVYLTAGMGGGTGTGAIPVIAEAVKNLGCLTVAVVTKPFAFEGARKMRIALEGIDKLSRVVDALIVIPNEKLLENSDTDTTVSQAFAMADEVLRQAVLGVTELITRPGTVNMDFADIKAVMHRSGIAVMGTGTAFGENRIEEALRQAMASPLMETAPTNATGILMNIASAGTLTIYELLQAAESLKKYMADSTVFVWGTVEDPELNDNVKITIIATGICDQVIKAQEQPEVKQKVENKARRLIFKKEENGKSVVTAAPQQPETTPDQSESFIPAWLRSSNSEKAKHKPEPVREIQPELPEETEDSVYDEPTWIRRKATAPKIY